MLTRRKRNMAEEKIQTRSPTKTRKKAQEQKPGPSREKPVEIKDEPSSRPKRMAAEVKSPPKTRKKAQEKDLEKPGLSKGNPVEDEAASRPKRKVAEMKAEGKSPPKTRKKAEEKDLQKPGQSREKAVEDEPASRPKRRAAEVKSPPKTRKKAQEQEDLQKPGPSRGNAVEMKDEPSSRPKRKVAEVKIQTRFPSKTRKKGQEKDLEKPGPSRGIPIEDEPVSRPKRKTVEVKSSPKTRKGRQQAQKQKDLQKPGPSRENAVEDEPASRLKRKVAQMKVEVKSPPKTRKKATETQESAQSSPNAKKRMAKQSKNSNNDKDISQTAKIGKIPQKPKGTEDVDDLRDEEEDSSDKENTGDSGNASNSLNTSGEKKPIYKILNAKPSSVPMDQLIVVNEENAPGEDNQDVYSFELSQNGNEKKKKPKKRKATVAKPKIPKKPKMWDSKDVKRMQQKTAVMQRAAKLQSIPAHILEKVKGKELLRQSLMQSSTPFKTSANSQLGDETMEEEMSPIVSAENKQVPVDESFDDDEAEPHFGDAPENEESHSITKEMDKTHEIEPQPWRSDASLQLPTTSHIRHSGRDFLPTYSSDMIIKATPRKPKAPARAPQPGPSTKSDHVGETFVVHQSPQKADYTLENFFGFDTDDPIVVNREIVEKHGEEALQLERERVRQLAPPKRPKRTVQFQPQAAVIADNPKPSTSKETATEVPLVENLFATQETAPPTRRNYSRPQKQRKIESDSEDEPPVERPEGQAEASSNDGAQKKYKKKKPTVNKKDLKQKEELEEFCTSFNEMCADVEKFEMIIVKEEETS